MGLRRELQAELAQAFDTDLADAVAVVDGSRSVPGTYDPEKGGSAPAATLHYAGRGVFGQYKAQRSTVHASWRQTYASRRCRTSCS